MNGNVFDDERSFDTGTFEFIAITIIIVIRIHGTVKNVLLE